MDTFELPHMSIEITTASLHDITHHDLFSPHRHSPVFFAYGAHHEDENKKHVTMNEIHAYKENEKNNDDKLVELFMLMSQSWS